MEHPAALFRLRSYAVDNISWTPLYCQLPAHRVEVRNQGIADCLIRTDATNPDSQITLATGSSEQLDSISTFDPKVPIAYAKSVSGTGPIVIKDIS